MARSPMAATRARRRPTSASAASAAGRPHSLADSAKIQAMLMVSVSVRAAASRCSLRIPSVPVPRGMRRIGQSMARRAASTAESRTEGHVEGQRGFSATWRATPPAAEEIGTHTHGLQPPSADKSDSLSRDSPITPRPPADPPESARIPHSPDGRPAHTVGAHQRPCAACRPRSLQVCRGATCRNRHHTVANPRPAPMFVMLRACSTYRVLSSAWALPVEPAEAEPLRIRHVPDTLGSWDPAAFNEASEGRARSRSISEDRPRPTRTA